MRITCQVLAAAVLAAGAALPAQSPHHAPPLPRFDVIAIEPASPGQMGNGSNHAMGSVDPTRWRAQAMGLASLIANAYGMQLGSGRSRVVGLPSWAMDTAYDIDAVVPPHTDAAQIPLMVRAMLQARFAMVARLGTRPMRAGTLSVAPGGAKLQRDRACDAAHRPIEINPFLAGGRVANTPLGCGGWRISRLRTGQFSLTVRMSMAQLALFLSRPNLPIVDQTGLKGAYDFRVDYRGMMAVQARRMTAAQLRDYRAQQRQAERAAYLKLGLVLNRERPRKLPVPVVMVEHIAKPAPN